MNLYEMQNLHPPVPWNIRIVDETSSTNTDLLQQSLPHGTVLLARAQRAGKGSRGRSFFSPKGGIYLSLLLEDHPTEQLSMLTPMAAVAVLRALRPHTNKDLSIKWVNDIYLDGGKVCGILTETRFCGAHHRTAVGVGINLLPPPEGFPDGFLHRPASLLTEASPHIAEEIINAFLKEMHSLLAKGEFLKEYKENCCTLGKRVTLARGDEIFTGRAVDILADGALMIRTEEGKMISFASGEVTSQI